MKGFFILLPSPLLIGDCRWAIVDCLSDDYGLRLTAEQLAKSSLNRQ
jgi:hypothetical protein